MAKTTATTGAPAGPTNAELYADTYGVLAEFSDVPSIVAAAERCRDEGFRHWDVYAPVPIHGIDEAMGVGPSKVSFCMGMGALTGFLTAMLLQWWTQAGPNVSPEWLAGYEIVTGGKPFFSWEQSVPVTFELSVLISAFATLTGMLLLNGLPRPHHPLMLKDRFLKAGDDGLFIAIEARDEKFDPDATAELLRSLGATSVEMVEQT